MPKISRAGGSTRAGLSQTGPQPVLVRGRRIIVRDGAIEFSDGTGALPDVALYRNASGELVIGQTLTLGGNVTIGGTLGVTGTLTAFGYFGAGGNVGLGSVSSEIGFFGETPAARPEVTGARNDAEAALASLLTALDTLGLITNSTTSGI